MRISLACLVLILAVSSPAMAPASGPMLWVPQSLDAGNRPSSASTTDLDDDSANDMATASLHAGNVPVIGNQTGSDGTGSLWTVLVFMNGDNNLESAAIYDINEMEIAGSTSDVNIIVQVDRIPGYDITNGDWTDTRRYRIEHDPNTFLINSTRLDVSSPLGELDMGSPQTLIDFVTWGIDEYPAEKYAVVVWDHGSGWTKSTGEGTPVKDLSNDATDGSNISVSNGEWESAISSIRSHLGKNIDLIGFDMCLMQMWEVAAVTNPYADYMVGSEETETYFGWRYDPFLAALILDPTMGPAELGSEIVNAAIDSGGQRTQSCLQLSDIPGLTASVDNLGVALMSAAIESDHRSTIDSLRRQLSTEEHVFYFRSHIDLYEYCGLVEAENSLPADLRYAASSVMASISSCVTHNRTSGLYNWTNGLAIYYPRSPASYDHRYDSLAIVPQTHWDDFLLRTSDMGFRPDPDGWQFENTRSTMWPYPWSDGDPADECCLCEGEIARCFPTWSLWREAFGAEQVEYSDGSRRPTAEARWQVWKGCWSGSGCGFAISSYLFFDGHFQLEDEFPGSIELFDVSLADESRHMINMCSVHQLGQTHWSQIIEGYNSSTPNQTLRDCQEMCNSYFSPRDDQVLVLWNNHGSGCHAVNPYKCVVDIEDPNTFYIYVYDNSFPGLDTLRVKINTAENTWHYDAMPDWGGSRHISLMDPVSNYAMQPVLADAMPALSMTVNEDKDADADNVEMYFHPTDTVRIASSQGEIGKIGDSLFSSLPAGCPIIPITGVETPPIGYFLPDAEWGARITGHRDSSFSLSVFADSTVMVYNRENVGPVHVESVRFAGSSGLFMVYNENQNYILYSLDIISAMPDSEIVCGVRNIRAAAADSIEFSSSIFSGLQIDNYGGATSYSVRVQIVGANTDTVFYNDRVTISSNATHSIIPDWRQYGDSLVILVDAGMTGEYGDTLMFANEGGPAPSCCIPPTVGDVDQSGGVDITDISVLIDNQFLTLTPLTCADEGDVDFDRYVDITDLSILIDNQFLSLTPLPPCP